MSETRTLHRSVKQRLGGRWAVSILGYLILFPVTLATFLLTDDSVTGESLAVVTVIGVMSNLTAGAVMAIASATVLRNRREHPVPVLLVIGVGATAGMIRSATIAALLVWWSVPSVTPVWSRLLLGIFLGAFAIPALAYVLDVWDQFTTERGRLIDALAQEERRASSDARYLAALRETIILDTQQQVESALTQAQRRIESDSTSPQDVVTVLRSTVDEEIREASHELWAPSDRSRSVMRPRDLLGWMVATRPFAPEWVVVPLAIEGFILLQRTLTAGPALAVVTGYSIYVATLMVLANRLIRRTERHRYAVFWLTMGLLALSGVWLGLAIYGLTGDRAFALAWVVTGALVGVVSAPLGGIGPALAQQAEKVLATLRREISTTEIQAEAMEKEAEQLKRMVARHLHGTVRANLTAFTMRIDDAIRRGDDEGAILAMADAKELLSVQLGRDLAHQTRTLHSEIDNLAGQWKGLLDIRSHVSEDIELTSGETRSLTELVTEAVHDAARHANAGWIDIRVDVVNASIVVRVENDGSYHLGDAGLGSRSLDELAPGAWRREESAEQTVVLTVEIPRHL